MEIKDYLIISIVFSMVSRVAPIEEADLLRNLPVHILEVTVIINSYDPNHHRKNST
jgi:hypothetical protein